MNARELGKNMTIAMIDRVIQQLEINGIETVNLGGNEPIFTNGIDYRDSLLGYIIESLDEANIRVGLTTSGISIIKLRELNQSALRKLNDVDVSFDSPFEHEHNRSRGAKIFKQAIQALETCVEYEIPRTCIMAAMNWNFSEDHIEGLCELARAHEANVRINPIKPTEPRHMKIALPAEDYFAGFRRLFELCDPLDLGEPPIAAVTNYSQARRCPCGRTSFRIHSITPGGKIFVSPCVYLHDYKSEMNLLEHDLIEIINSPQFRVFRQRNENPSRVIGCTDCHLLESCGGGCSARSYLYYSHMNSGAKSFRAKDPYCPKNYQLELNFPQNPSLVNDQRLVHMDYLCTWIGRPR